MHQRIEEMGDGSNLLKAHVFQFDFLNGDFADLPKGLQDIINDEEKRKRLVIYINPPFKEHPSSRNLTSESNSKTGLAKSATYDKYASIIGSAARELYAQFIFRIYREISGCILAQFSTVKILNSQNFFKFRENYQAKLKSLFVSPSFTFDNVQGQFPIGFFIWDTSEKQIFDSIEADVYEANGLYTGIKEFKVVPKNRYVIDWLRRYYDKTNTRISYLRILGTDMQCNKYIFVTNNPSANDFKEKLLADVTSNNLIVISIYYTIRHVIEPTWINNRDQFLYPDENWIYDRDFQGDCLAYLLFDNRVTSEQGINHWIPFTEQQVNAPDNFQSHFMSDFINGKLKPQNADTLLPYPDRTDTIHTRCASSHGSRAQTMGVLSAQKR